MKVIKVIDVGTNQEEVEFGTCELCFRYGMADNPYMVLEFAGYDRNLLLGLWSLLGVQRR